MKSAKVADKKPRTPTKSSAAVANKLDRKIGGASVCVIHGVRKMKSTSSVLYCTRCRNIKIWSKSLNITSLYSYVLNGLGAPVYCHSHRDSLIAIHESKRFLNYCHECSETDLDLRKIMCQLYCSEHGPFRSLQSGACGLCGRPGIKFSEQFRPMPYSDDQQFSDVGDEKDLADLESLGQTQSVDVTECVNSSSRETGNSDVLKSTLTAKGDDAGRAAETVGGSFTEDVHSKTRGDEPKELKGVIASARRRSLRERKVVKENDGNKAKTLSDASVKRADGSDGKGRASKRMDAKRTKPETKQADKEPANKEATKLGDEDLPTSRSSTVKGRKKQTANKDAKMTEDGEKEAFPDTVQAILTGDTCTLHSQSSIYSCVIRGANGSRILVCRACRLLHKSRALADAVKMLKPTDTLYCSLHPTSAIVAVENPPAHFCSVCGRTNVVSDVFCQFHPSSSLEQTPSTRIVQGCNTCANSYQRNAEEKIAHPSRVPNLKDNCLIHPTSTITVDRDSAKFLFCNSCAAKGREVRYFCDVHGSVDAKSWKLTGPNRIISCTQCLSPLKIDVTPKAADGVGVPSSLSQQLPADVTPSSLALCLSLFEEMKPGAQDQSKVKMAADAPSPAKSSTKTAAAPSFSSPQAVRDDANQKGSSNSKNARGREKNSKVNELPGEYVLELLKRAPS